MASKFTFHKTYFILTVLLLFTEVLIALFMHDRFVRPYVGDVLVVLLLYCLVKTFFEISVWKATLGVLLFAYGVEILQYFRIVEVLGLQEVEFARIVIGVSFSWFDMLAYTIGVALVLLLEKWANNL